MNNKILLALPMSVLLAACAAPMTRGCPPINVPDVCTSSNQSVNLNVRRKVKVAPPNVCAERGKEFEFKITPSNTTTSVAIIPKNAADTWLVGINSPNSDSIKIDIPNTVPLDTDHEYYIVTTNGYCYDPRIHIRTGG